MARRAIGVVGGVGPYAGLDLNRKIYEQCMACSDQDHVNVYLISAGGHIPDRTDYLLRRQTQNPADGILAVLRQLDRLGVPVAAVPCNTSHAGPIFSRVREGLQSEAAQIRLLHMIEELGRFLREQLPAARRIGVLATDGTVASNVYGECLRRYGLEVLYPDQGQQRRVHAAIYDPDYGIKANGQPVTARARRQVLEAFRALGARGADAVVLGCSELPLAVRPGMLEGCPIVDSTAVLARALVREVAPEKLRPPAWERPRRQQVAR